MKFLIAITETLVRTKEIETNTEEQAIDFVQHQYKNSEIILDANDFQDYTIEVVDG